MIWNTTGKLPLQSGAFVGALVGLIAVVLQCFGYHVDKPALTNDILQGITILSLIWSLWRTIKRTQPIVWTRGTVPGGPFNPQAEVRKALPVDSRPSTLDSEQGAAVLQAICALVVCGVIGLILAACHPSGESKVEGRESKASIPTRDPEVPRVLHPDLRPLASDLWHSLQVTPGVDIGTNSHGQTIYGPSITLRGGVEF